MNPEREQGLVSDRVEVVVVNWNTGKYLSRCLDSLFSCHPGLNMSVVVVDNASADGSASAAEGRDNVRLIVNEVNRGFAVAVNQGFQKLSSSTGWVLVLNPDVEFTADVIGPLMDFAQNKPDAGILTARIVRSDGSFQPSCRRREPSPWNMLTNLSGLSNIFPDSDFFAGYFYGGTDSQTPHEVDAVSGSFMLIRREVIDAVGVLDERYFMYAEDLEYCRRARCRGWRIWYVPVDGAVHHGAVSSSQRKLRSLWHKHCTAIKYVNHARRKDFSAPARWSISLTLLLLFPLRALLALVWRRRKVDGD